MSRKLIVSLLFIGFSLIVFVIYGQLRIRKLEMSKEKAEISESSQIPDFNPFFSKIEIVSDVPNFTVKKDKVEKFYEVLRDWRVFSDNNFYLHSLDKSVSPAKIIFHLTDKKQPYQFVYENNSDKIIQSVGEEYDEDKKTLSLFFHVDSSILSTGELSSINKMFNEFIIIALYTRTHKGDQEYMENTKELISSFVSKQPFILNRK